MTVGNTVSLLFSDPEGIGGGMKHKNFPNLFGASVASYNDRIISCASRDQWKTPYEKYMSEMGKYVFLAPGV